MKLNNMLHTFTIFITIVIICLYHYYIQSRLEKIFSQTYFTYDDIKRPSKKCNANGSQNLSCIGVPSSHVESITILAFLLYKYNFIPLWVSIVSIVGVSLQKIINNKHTVFQVCIGSIIGFIYAHIYLFCNLSIYAVVFVVGLGLFLVVLSLCKIDSFVHSPIPAWVDTSMIPIIRKKQDIPFYLKVLTIYSNAILQNRTFISWKDLETYLDELIYNIKAQNIQYDAVVGIKTGGAIISDYVSSKLKLPNYKIKLTRSEYNCNKRPSHAINDAFHRVALNNYGDYLICEGIYDDLKGRNIILIDEMVSSGNTMNQTIQYLKNEKHANRIQPTCISFSKENFQYNYNISYVLPTSVFVWPWGFDN